MLLHHTARGLRGRLLFHDHVEARALWLQLTRCVPGPVALCLMPDHLHLLVRRDYGGELARAMSAFARWRNAHRAERGAVWAPAGPPQPIPPGDKEPRVIRYVHLNPCRAGLAVDPLAWPWSTYRDRMGLAIPAILPEARDVYDLHAYTSGDPSVRIDGTLLPTATDLVKPGADGIEALIAAVSEATRTPLDQVRGARGSARSLLLRCGRCTTGPTTRELARHLGLSLRAVQLVADRPDEAVQVVQRLLADPRFPGLPGGDLRRDPTWQRWLARRAAAAAARGP